MNKIDYALGMRVAYTLLTSGVKTLNMDDFNDGLTSVFAGKDLKLKFNESEKLLDEYFDKLKTDQEQEFLKEGEDYMIENAKRDDVVTTKSGLQYKVIKEGTGKSPSVHSRVRCHYTGTLVDGKKFDSSYDRNQPAVFGLNQVIPGWTEGLQLMKEGAVYEFTIPYKLAYGENGIPGVIPPCATLIFKVELIEVL